MFSGRFVVPSPHSVLTTAVKDHLYLSDLKVTLLISWKGYLIGNGAALLLAAICLIAPPAENALMTLGVATYCVPTIAVGPLFVVLYGSDGAKVVMSALSVFFIPMRSVVWRIWRWRFDSSTTSSSTIPSVPTPAAAR